MPASDPSSWPWHHLNSPLHQWDVMPSFLLGEHAFILLALLCLWHATRQGEGRRRHVFVWAAALLAGTANDLFFMALPLVDNFWQAQATWMITARLPLYIPCVYVCFLYLPTVSAWRLGLPWWARAPASGLFAIAFYAPYDVVGAKFLWWTWHDTDRPIASRLLGVPIGSTVWVIVFAATFAAIVGRVTDADPSMRPRSLAKGTALVAALTTPTMMLQMAPLQLLDGGAPGPRGLVAIVAAYAALLVAGARRARAEPPAAMDGALFGGVAAHLALLAGIMVVARPEAHRSESAHQTYGACHVEAKDLSGNVRYAYLCAADFDEDFTFACAPPPAEGQGWYTVCGKPHDRYMRMVLATSAMAALGAAVYGAALVGRARLAREAARA
ncbi:MAG: hypothetical protein IT374_15600 [Polyangiaceae bacterium]|nr:hypothetical protein [Polyangiaceae bacterium]